MNPFFEFRDFPTPGYYVNKGKLKSAVLLMVAVMVWFKAKNLWGAVRAEISRQWKGGRQ